MSDITKRFVDYLFDKSKDIDERIEKLEKMAGVFNNNQGTPKVIY